MYTATSVWNTILTYNGNTVFLVLFLVSWLYCLVTFSPKQKKMLVVVTVISILCIYNDLSMKIMAKFAGAETYYRFLWAVPLIPLAAYAMVQVVSRRKRLVSKIVIGAILAAVVCVGGKSYINSATLVLPQNKYGIPEDVLQVSAIIQETKETEQPVIAADISLQMPIRTYDASVLWGYSREAFLYMANDNAEESPRKDEYTLIRLVNNGEQSDLENLKRVFAERSIDYLIIRKDFQMDDYLAQVACTKIGESNQYSVYAVDRERK